MEEGKRSLFAKMAAVMGQVGYIKKRGRNQAQNYDYVMAADIAGEMAKLFAERGLAFYPMEQKFEWDVRESQRGNAMFVCKAAITYRIVDTESGEGIAVPSFGEGWDTGDKAAYKAMTGALKYALIQTFLIAAGDDPEEETEVKETKAPTGAPKVVEQPQRPACPLCGAVGSIIKGRPEFGGGWVCYAKKGGCGAKFRDDDARLNPPRRLGDVGAGDVGSVRTSSQGGDQGSPLVDGSSQLGEGNREVRDSGGTRISEAQIGELEALCREFEVAPSTLIRQYRMSDPKIQTLADLSEGHYQHALRVFKSKRERAEKLN